MPWSRRFDDPIPLGSLDTLRQAGEYIAALPSKQAKAHHWQLAMHCLIEAAEGRQPLLHASVGMLRALNHDRPVSYRTKPKDPVWKQKWREQRR